MGRPPSKRGEIEVEFEYPPRVTQTPGELRAYLHMALIDNDRSAELALLHYFRNAWQLGMEPDAFVLRNYCDHIFGKTLERYKARPKDRLFIVRKAHRPRRPFGLTVAKEILVAALFRLLQLDQRYEDALRRTGRVFH